MSFLTILCDTYNNLQKIDYKDRRNLLSVAHSTQKAHITVILDKDGNFVRADFVADVEGKEKNLSQTLIPVSEKSASRSSGIAPHPLCDKLKYLAGDYNSFVEIKTSKDTNTGYFEKYMENLEDFKKSSNNIKLDALFKYLSKKTLIADLISSEIFSTNENNKLTDKWEKANVKLSAGGQTDSFIRFEILDGSKTTKVWQDKNLQEDYIRYYKSGDDDFCYISGEIKSCSDNHPSKIRNSADKAKLISANDTSGFTYRGRFENSDQAFKVSYEVSQKAHNALKFLIEEQGERLGDKVFLLFGTDNEDTPKLNCDTFDLLFDDGEIENFGDTRKTMSEQFNKAMSGYKSKVNQYTNFCIIGLDAATTGRAAIIFYREYRGQDVIHFLENIEKWHKTGEWLHKFKNKNKSKVYFYGMPSPYDISLCAYGKEEGDFLGGNDKVLSNTTERLIPSISDGAKIPRDIVSILVKKCYSPQSYKNEYNWNKVLSVTCSVYKKYLFDYKGEEIDMKINENINDISYLCGRLLAVADEIERYALYDQTGSSGARTTNAMRYFNRFARTPNDTWAIISDKLNPYIARLGSKGTHLYALKQEISAKIDPEEFANAKNLDGKMALGFDSQKQAIYNRKNKEEDK